MSATPETLSVVHAATQYVAQGWALVAIAAGTKGPNSPGWNERRNCITTATEARTLRGSVGLAHAYSGTCAFDIDDLEGTRAWFAKRGVDLEQFLTDPQRVGIKSGRANRAKLLFALALPLVSIKVKGLDASGARVTLFELRCATADGLTVQDVTPPSVHPETGQPYTWDLGIAGDRRYLPPLPDALRAVWTEGGRADTHGNGDALDTYKPATGLSISETRALLRKVDARDYDTWLHAGMALHHEYGDDGFELWDTWSAGAPNYQGTGDLEHRWRGFGSGGGSPVTLRAVIKWAREADAAALSAEPVLAAGAAPAALGEGVAAAVSRFPVERLADFANRPAPPWLVKGLLPAAGLGVLFGESASGKSFAALDLVGACVQGKAWRGHRVAKPLRVVYVVAEGAGGFRLRVRAYAQAEGVHLDDLDGLGVIGNAPNLMRVEDVRDLRESVQAWGGPAGVDVIVVDTLAQTTPGANENSGEDMGLALGHCRYLHQHTGALVLLVHHSGKDSSKGARGWSGLRAAADVELEVLRDGDARHLKVTKLKDGAEGAQFHFTLAPVHLGVDDDGDPITSCSVAAGDAPRKEKRRPTTPNKRAVLEAIESCDAEGRVGPLTRDELLPVVRKLRPGLKRDDLNAAIASLTAEGWLASDLDSVLLLVRQ